MKATLGVGVPVLNHLDDAWITVWLTTRQLMTENVCHKRIKLDIRYSDRRKMNAAASDSDSSVSIAGAGENGNDTPLECREDTKHVSYKHKQTKQNKKTTVELIRTEMHVT